MVSAQDMGKDLTKKDGHWYIHEADGIEWSWLWQDLECIGPRGYPTSSTDIRGVDNKECEILLPCISSQG